MYTAPNPLRTRARALALGARLTDCLSWDLLRPEERRRNLGCMARHPHMGHCYVASEALWHALGRPDWLQPWVARVSDTFAGGTHWWLAGSVGIVDPTRHQFPTWVAEMVRDSGRRCGFLTVAPSRRARELLRRAGLLERLQAAP